MDYTLLPSDGSKLPWQVEAMQNLYVFRIAVYGVHFQRIKCLRETCQ